MNNLELVKYAEGWLNFNTAYGWGCWGQPISQDIINRKAAQYPSHYSPEKQAYLLSQRPGFLIDCVGLIKGAYWLQTPGNGYTRYDPKTDVDANSMYTRAIVKGPIATMPEIKGLCVQMDGHIGIYVGKQTVIESTSSKVFGDGVVYTKIWDRPWEHWLQCPYIDYIKEDAEVVDFKEMDPVRVVLDGVERTDCGLISVEGRATTFIPAIALRECGIPVTWDGQKVIINTKGVIK